MYLFFFYFELIGFLNNLLCSSFVSRYILEVLSLKAIVFFELRINLKDIFPLERKCLDTNIVYEAKVTSNNRNYQEKVDFGSCKTTFKKQFSNHKNHLTYMNVKMKQSYQVKSGE